MRGETKEAGKIRVSYDKYMGMIFLMSKMAGALRVVMIHRGAVNAQAIQEIVDEYHQFWTNERRNSVLNENDKEVEL